MRNIFEDLVDCFQDTSVIILIASNGSWFGCITFLFPPLLTVSSIVLTLRNIILVLPKTCATCSCYTFKFSTLKTFFKVPLPFPFDLFRFHQYSSMYSSIVQVIYDTYVLPSSLLLANLCVTYAPTVSHRSVLWPGSLFILVTTQWFFIVDNNNNNNKFGIY